MTWFFWAVSGQTLARNGMSLSSALNTVGAANGKIPQHANHLLQHPKAQVPLCDQLFLPDEVHWQLGALE